MGICEIASDRLVARVSDDGAELVGLTLCGQSHSWIWPGKEPWKRSAPLLFPIVGKLRDNSYSYDGQLYTLAQHGFARDLKFKVADVNGTSVVLELSESPETLSQYPFKFTLQVKYQVDGQSLLLSIQLRNTDDKTAYFSLGWHPAFVLPMQNDIAGLSISADKALGEAHFLHQGLLSLDKKLRFGQNVPIIESSFQDDAWIFKDNPCQEIAIADRGGNLVRIHCGGSPSLGVWTKDPAKFVCIEPWWGFSDFEYGSSLIQDKAGIQALEAGKEWNAAMSVTVSQRL